MFIAPGNVFESRKGGKMILSAALIVKILLLLLVYAIFFYFLRNKISRKHLSLGASVIILFGLAANEISGLLPPLTDSVTLTALGESQEAARGMEICLAGYTVDGKDFICGSSLEIEKGQWFWSGESYLWRPEADSRQPEGVTREVVLRLPVGWNRTLHFKNSIWRGMVQISTSEKTWIVDLYSENPITYYEEIGGSESKLLIFNQMRHLLGYAGSLFLLAASAILILWWMLQNPETVYQWLNRNSGKLIYAGIAIVTFVFMVYYADRESLWLDELLQINLTKGTIGEAIQSCLSVQDYTPPLPDICAALWYHIAPYGERWLLLISIVPVVCAIYVIGLTGEVVKGKTCGILSALFMAFSTTVWLNAAYEYRAYAFLVCFSTMAFYFYVKRNLEKEQKRWLVLLSVSLTGLLMSHYFGFLVCAGIFFADFLLFMKKQWKLYMGIAYFLPGIVGVFWLTAVYEITMQYKTTADLSSWPPVPGFSHVMSLLKFLSGDYEVICWILLAGIALSLALLFYKKSEGFDWERFYIQFTSFMIVCTIILLFVYGNFVNPNSTMWVNRYFLGLLPYALILSGMTLVRTIEWINYGRKETLILKTVCIFVGLSLFINCMIPISALKSSEPYREAADWIYEQSNFIFNEDTAIIMTPYPTVIDGFSEYYITRQGRRDPLNIISQHRISKEELLRYKKVYVISIHNNVIADLQKILEENYDIEDTKSELKIKVYVSK